MLTSANLGMLLGTFLYLKKKKKYITIEFKCMENPQASSCHVYFCIYKIPAEVVIAAPLPPWNPSLVAAKTERPFLRLWL